MKRYLPLSLLFPLLLSSCANTQENIDKGVQSVEKELQTIANASSAAALPLQSAIEGTVESVARTTHLPGAVFTNLEQGAAANIPITGLADYPHLERVITKVDGPQYLISDDPEYIRVPEGIAMQETVEPGPVRLYVYNVNGVKEPEQIDRKITVMIENLESQTLTIEWHRYSFRAPSTNYFGVAKNGLWDYFTEGEAARKRPPLVIPPRSMAALDPVMDSAIVKYDELVHGLYEFKVNRKARISVLQTAPGTDGVRAMQRNPEILKSPRNNAGRGLFFTSNYKVTGAPGKVLDTANGPVQLIVADGETDPWVSGVDNTTGSETLLKGNYGVIYEMEFLQSSSDGRGLALMTYNGRFGSQWCGGMANVIGVSEGQWPAGFVKAPSNQLTTKSAPEMVVLQVFPPLPVGETRTIKLTYSPPGASCLPTPLVFVPVQP